MKSQRHSLAGFLLSAVGIRQAYPHGRIAGMSAEASQTPGVLRKHHRLKHTSLPASNPVIVLTFSNLESLQMNRDKTPEQRT